MNALGVCVILGIAVYVLCYDKVLLFINLAILAGYYLFAYRSLTPTARYADNVWRRLRLSMWEDPFTPEVLGEERVLMSRTIQYCKDYTRRTGKKVTVAHALLKASGIAISKAEEMKGKIAFGAYTPYEETRLTTFIPADDGKTLKWVVFDDLDKKSLSAISDECKLASHKSACASPVSSLSILPTCVLSILLELASLVTIEMGIGLPFLGLKRHPFGCAVITNFSDVEADMIWAPFVPTCRVPMAVTGSKIVKEAVAIDGKIVVEDVFHLCATIDHRFVDGTRGAVVANDVKRILENPDEYFS